MPTQCPLILASDWSRPVNIVMNIVETIFRMPIYPMLNHMNIDELNISFYVKPRPCVLGQATLSDLNVVNPGALCPIDHDCTLDRFSVTTHPLTQSLGVAWYTLGILCFFLQNWRMYGHNMAINNCFGESYADDWSADCWRCRGW